MDRRAAERLGWKFEIGADGNGRAVIDLPHMEEPFEVQAASGSPAACEDVLLANVSELEGDPIRVGYGLPAPAEQLEKERRDAELARPPTWGHVRAELKKLPPATPITALELLKLLEPQ